MANLNCMIDQVFFFWPGIWGQHPIYNQVYASHCVHLDKLCQLCAKNFQKVGIFDQSCNCSWVLLCRVHFLVRDSVLCVSVKGIEHKTGWESKKSSPLAHDTHFAELRQRIEEKRAKMWQRREYRWALVLVVWRGYMFLSTQRLEEEKLGKVERKVEPEKNK